MLFVIEEEKIDGKMKQKNDGNTVNTYQKEKTKKTKARPCINERLMTIIKNICRREIDLADDARM
jgi:hypothetical protein